eukprot:TRINITY_DN2922_c0_g1_i1.p1 TRINITY_DN2922_c0_g1~~TRINITY_DN2922_c0_g1_i1.p1  ORF type:complete len:464 (-),score=97.93 TRINITY_DN2922_c0_g1_i1:16-1407(-)
MTEVKQLDDKLLQTMTIKSLKRSYDMFLSNLTRPTPVDATSQAVKLSTKIEADFSHVKDLPASLPPAKKPRTTEAKAPKVEDDEEGDSAVGSVISDLEAKKLSTGSKTGTNNLQIVSYNGTTKNGLQLSTYQKFKKPEWHAPWKLDKVIAGHNGWVRCAHVEPANEWFVTGSADRTIKLWDLASGTLKLTLTGHIATVRGVHVSHRHNYLFSCGEDRKILCWDLEQNKVIRHYYGHLNGIYCIDQHPTLDLIFTGGRDSTCRVWDIRTKGEVHTLVGHKNTVACVNAQAVNPQVTTGAADSTIRLWDLAAGRCNAVLTNHKKSIRDMCLHPREFTFLSAAADNIKKWKYPEGKFMNNITGHKAILNTIAVNNDDVIVSGGDNGSVRFYDYKSGYCFQDLQTRVQPGSLESEAGIFASTFDKSGSRYISCEADKTIKIYKEDDEATPETHPIDPMWKPSKSNSF